MTSISIFLAVFLGSCLAVRTVRRFSLTRSILDLPNSRSSHSEPTPRGGGLGIIAAFVVAASVFLAANSTLTLSIGSALAGMVLLSVVGWADDRTGVSVQARLAVHCTAGLMLAPLAIGSGASLWQSLSLVTAWALLSVSAINVVNFMDGIDGLVGSQAVIFGFHLWLLGPAGSEAHVWGLILAASCTGFLVWNWPPARIFMGDTGSGSLGFAIVAGGLLVNQSGGVPLFAVFLPLYPLALDATTTLLRRMIRGERVWEAHRTHLYQRLANGGWGHRNVTLLFMGLALAGWLVAYTRGSQLWPWLATVYLLGVLIGGVVLHHAYPLPRSCHLCRESGSAQPT